MEESQEKEEWTAFDYRLTFTEIKSLASLGLKILEDVKGENIPMDQELRGMLHTVIVNFIYATKDLESMDPEIPNLNI